MEKRWPCEVLGVVVPIDLFTETVANLERPAQPYLRVDGLTLKPQLLRPKGGDTSPPRDLEFRV